MKKTILILLSIPLLCLQPLQSSNYESSLEHQDQHSWELDNSSMLKTSTGMLVNAFFISVGVILGALIFKQDPPDDITSSEKASDLNGKGNDSFPPM